MTHRIYYTEPYRRCFDATVVAVDNNSDRCEVVLDQTAFYPTSGGQPFDTGTLGSSPVIDVIDRPDGSIAHIVSGRLNVGDVVAGTIDWARRFDHMQQHTGQHVLSASFDRLFGVRTESFHMGHLHPTAHPTRGAGAGPSSTIDLAREVTADEIAKAEDHANSVVWENRAVNIRFVSADEAATMPLRKESARVGSLRLVEVLDHDLSACGGTHVDRTGGIGVIAIAGAEKFKGGTRIEFLCGDRALQRFRTWRGALSAMQKRLSVPPVEMAAALDRMQDDAKATQRTLRSFQEKLTAHEARALLARGAPVVAESLDGWDAQGLKAIAVAATAAQPEAVLALFTATNPAQVVIACGAGSRADAAMLLKKLTEQFGGKGGGRSDLAQGGGLNATAAELIAFVTSTVTSAPS